jgi:hypothetical protein
MKPESIKRLETLAKSMPKKADGLIILEAVEIINNHPHGVPLLDYFAGQALADQLGNPRPTPTKIAKRAYEVAEAMLLERAK